MKYSPLVAIPKAIWLRLKHRAEFPEEHIGEIIIRDDGVPFEVFREVQMTYGANQPEIPQGVFQVWFKTKAEIKDTIQLSNTTLYAFMGLPGFRSKLWLLNEVTGEFGGIYEWDTLQEAENYDKSYAMKLSEMRALPGEFRTVVFHQSDQRA